MKEFVPLCGNMVRRYLLFRRSDPSRVESYGTVSEPYEKGSRKAALCCHVLLSLTPRRCR